MHQAKEANVLFNDTLNTFYLRLCGVRRMLKTTQRETKPAAATWAISFINSKDSFKCHPTYRIAHTTAFVIPVVEHWLEREIAQWVHHDRTLLPWSYISLFVCTKTVHAMAFVTPVVEHWLE